ncbi:hypothetical protein EDD37DRAFT_667007 [Exophiala viscosa]|uniref:uncharacterized protein n=1 Tax=Exophiala viscosa TaxID=2486360 RepID=UPI002198B7F9|nr:hypothetical protein EDD37DRAFT_667007 [Exophiala viscosa]
MGPKLLAALFSLVVTTIAIPVEPEIEARAVNCKIVDAVINYFTPYTAQASSFCSAYLQTTATVSVTTGKVTGTVTVTQYSTAVNTFVKRDTSVPRPTWLPKAIAANLVSSACSCYITPPPAKTTKTTITTGTTTVTVSKSAAATQTVTEPIYCGVVGVIYEFDSEGNPVYLASGGGYTLQQCKALCVSEPACLTFIYDDDGTGACTTVPFTIAGHFDPGSSLEITEQYNYDRNCAV